MEYTSPQLKVLLQFNGSYKAWQFYKDVQPLAATVDLCTAVLRCHCTTAEIAIAQTRFGAAVTHVKE